MRDSVVVGVGSDRPTEAMNCVCSVKKELKQLKEFKLYGGIRCGRWQCGGAVDQVASKVE